MMHGKIRRGTVVRAQRVATKPADLSLNQQFCRVDGESREMHAALGVLIAILLHIGPASCPAGSEQHDGSLRNAAVRLLPFFDARCGELVVGVARSCCADIQDHTRSEELLDRNLIDRCFAWWKVNWRVEVCAVVLQHPEAACE